MARRSWLPTFSGTWNTARPPFETITTCFSYPASRKNPTMASRLRRSRGVLCASGEARIVELRLNKSRWETVGDLRNLALEHATGDFIVNWDDDDWHHPRRIEVQMQARGEDTAVLLRTRIHHSLVNGCSRYAE